MANGFAIGDVDLIGDSMSDAVVEPARAFLIPGYKKVKGNALKAGAVRSSNKWCWTSHDSHSQQEEG